MRALLVLLLLLGALLVVADRVAVSVAEDRVGTRIADEADLAGAPEVDITGFPFLTQAVGGRYEEVRLVFTARDLGQPRGTAAEVSLRGVDVPLPDVLEGSVQQIPVERIDGSATLSYELLAQEIGPSTELERAGEGLRLTRTVELAGQEVPLTAQGTVTLDGAELVIEVQEASGAGVDLPSGIVEQAGELLGLRYRVPDLPYGLELTDVRPEDDGVRVRAQAGGTVLGG